LREWVTGELKCARLWDDSRPVENLDAALGLLKSRAKKLTDFSGIFRAFFTDDFSYDEAAAGKFLADERLGDLIPALLERYRQDYAFTPQSAEEILRALADEAGVKAALLINAVRVGLTGQGVAPGLFEVMQGLGREKTLARLRRLSDYLGSRNRQS
jgi:glutamyl-tRNA synthetase